MIDVDEQAYKDNEAWLTQRLRNVLGGGGETARLARRVLKQSRKALADSKLEGLSKLFNAQAFEGIFEHDSRRARDFLAVAMATDDPDFINHAEKQFMQSYQSDKGAEKASEEEAYRRLADYEAFFKNMIDREKLLDAAEREHDIIKAYQNRTDTDREIEGPSRG